MACAPHLRGMPDLRLATLLLLAAGACWPLAASGAEGRARIPVDAEQRAELGRLVAQAIALGLPDLSGCRLFQGALAIHWRAAGAPQDLRVCEVAALLAHRVLARFISDAASEESDCIGTLPSRARCGMRSSAA